MAGCRSHIRSQCLEYISCLALFIPYGLELWISVVAGPTDEVASRIAEKKLAILTIF